MNEDRHFWTVIAFLLDDEGEMIVVGQPVVCAHFETGRVTDEFLAKHPYSKVLGVPVKPTDRVSLIDIDEHAEAEAEYPH